METGSVNLGLERFRVEKQNSATHLIDGDQAGWFFDRCIHRAGPRFSVTRTQVLAGTETAASCAARGIAPGRYQGASANSNRLASDF